MNTVHEASVVVPDAASDHGPVADGEWSSEQLASKTAASVTEASRRRRLREQVTSHLSRLSWLTSDYDVADLLGLTA